MVTNEMLNSYFGYTLAHISLWWYFGVSLALMVIIFLTYRLTYRKKYYTSGKEDMRLRMELADKIRKLPLSYLERRDLSDLTSVIMDDVATTANTLANTLTELISGLCSGIIALVLLFVYNWHLALSLAACLPLAVIAMSLCKLNFRGDKQKKQAKKTGDQRRPAGVPGKYKSFAYISEDGKLSEDACSQNKEDYTGTCFA